MAVEYDAIGLLPEQHYETDMFKIGQEKDIFLKGNTKGAKSPLA